MTDDIKVYLSDSVVISEPIDSSCDLPIRKITNADGTFKYRMFATNEYAWEWDKLSLEEKLLMQSNN